MQAVHTKGLTFVEIMIVVVIIGMLAAIAVPAFQKARTSSQEKSGLNHARQLSTAADQKYLENGLISAASAGLGGTTNYAMAINSVAAETYPANYRQGVTMTYSGVGGARTLTCAP